MLTQETAISYLLRRGRLDVRGIGRERSQCLRRFSTKWEFPVERQPGDALLLKQARVPNASRTVGSEAMIYKRLPSFACLASATPPYSPFSRIR